MIKKSACGRDGGKIYAAEAVLPARTVGVLAVAAEGVAAARASGAVFGKAVCVGAEQDAAALYCGGLPLAGAPPAVGGRSGFAGE